MSFGFLRGLRPLLFNLLPMTKVHLIRTQYSKDNTLGILEVEDKYNAVYVCNTLELPWRKNQRGISCVPPGSYRLVYEYSPKFKRMLWELKGVPGRSECKFHTANYVHQLNGCIAPGVHYIDMDGNGVLDITNSAKALDGLHEALKDITETIITIYGQP